MLNAPRPAPWRPMLPTKVPSRSKLNSSELRVSATRIWPFASMVMPVGPSSKAGGTIGTMVGCRLIELAELKAKTEGRHDVPFTRWFIYAKNSDHSKCNATSLRYVIIITPRTPNQ